MFNQIDKKLYKWKAQRASSCGLGAAKPKMCAEDALPLRSHAPTFRENAMLQYTSMHHVKTCSAPRTAALDSCWSAARRQIHVVRNMFERFPFAFRLKKRLLDVGLVQYAIK